MFSTTTMASSTTRPIASTIASKVKRLREKPNASISAAEPTSDSGIVTTGISTARRDPRNRKITTTTMRIASISVCVTSSRSEEHKSELQSLMRRSYADYCLKKKIKRNIDKILLHI